MLLIITYIWKVVKVFHVSRCLSSCKQTNNKSKGHLTSKIFYIYTFSYNYIRNKITYIFTVSSKVLLSKQSASESLNNKFINSNILCHNFLNKLLFEDQFNYIVLNINNFISLLFYNLYLKKQHIHFRTVSNWFVISLQFVLFYLSKTTLQWLLLSSSPIK